jgi:hypothetical protein
VTQFVALEKNAEKGIAGHMADAYRAYLAGDLDAFYEPLVVDDDAVRRSGGTYVVDTRLRDRLRALGFGEPGMGATTREETTGLRDAEAAAAFAAEYAVLDDADVGIALAGRVAEAERRVAALERLSVTGVRAMLGSGR